MKYFFYNFFLHVLLQLPDFFFAILFNIIFPIYKKTHKKSAYGRVILHLQTTGIANKFKKTITARDVFKSIYWNGIDSYRFLTRISSIQNRIRYENESVIQNALTQGPIVALSIHQGAFENLHRTLCRYSKNVHLITSPFKSTSLTQALHEIRSDEHLHEYTTDEIKTVLKNLFKTKGILAMVVDQARNARGNSVEIFGKKTTLYLRLPEKANQMGAGIVTFRTWSELKKNEKGKLIREHVVRFEKYYPPKYESKIQSTTFGLIPEITKEIETWIAEHPEQWTWNYYGNFR